MISLLVLLLLSVVVVGDAHAPPSSTIRQRTLQDRDTSSASVCSPPSFEYGGPCDVLTHDGKKCFFDYVYVGDCGATEEELECLPEMTCTCNGLRDETWACPQDRRRDSMTLEMMPAPCPDTGITVSVEPGDICTPGSPTSASTTSASASSTSSTSSSPATADDGTTPLSSKNAVDNDNDIDPVEVITPAVVDDKDSSTTITVKEGESDGAMSSLSSSSSSSSQQQGLGVAKVAMVAAATTTTAGITALFL